MPLTYTESVWRSLYSHPSGLTFGRQFRQLVWSDPVWTARLDRLTARLQNRAAPGDAVLVVGCAFGFLVERLLDLGFDAYGLDASPYVADNLAAEARDDVVPRVLTGATLGIDDTAVIAADLEALGAPRQGFHFVIDEDTVSSQADAEVAGFHQACVDLTRSPSRGSQVGHFVTTLPESGPGDTSLLWRTLDEWAATAPEHWWVDVVTGDVRAP